jgi:hypothetical protein
VKVRYEQTPENPYAGSCSLPHSLRHSVRRSSRRTWTRTQTCTTASSRQASGTAQTAGREASPPPYAAEDRPTLPSPAFPPRLPLVHPSAASVPTSDYQSVTLKPRKFISRGFFIAVTTQIPSSSFPLSNETGH